MNAPRRLENKKTLALTIVHALSNLPFRGRASLIRTMAHLFPSCRRFPLHLTAATTIRVDLRDNSSIGMLLGGGLPHEQGLLTLMKKFVAPGDVFYDIGANLGYYTCIFSEPSYRLRQVVAFEPNPGLVTQLQSNTGHRVNVVVVQAGLSSQPGVATFTYDPTRSGLGTFRPSSGKSSCSVELKTLDQLISSGQILPPSVVKLDVEGLEYRVLEGFSMRDEHRPAIFMEWSDTFSSAIGVSFGDLLRLLGENWAIYRVENDGQLRTEEIKKAITTNDLLVVWRGSHHHELAESLRGTQKIM